MIQFEAFRPADSIATVRLHDPVFDEPVSVVNDHLNSLGVDYFVNQANQAPNYEGQEYSIVGDEHSSQEAVILMPAPFGNGVWPHHIARAKAVGHLAELAGVRDRMGSPVPVLLVAAPSITSSYNLDQREQQQIARGNFASIAYRHIDLVNRLGYGGLSGYLGYSQPAVFAADIPAQAKPWVELNGPIQIQETPHSKKTTRPALGWNMAIVEGRRFKAAINDSGIDVVKQLFDKGKAEDRFIKGVIKRRKEYWPITRGFARGRLEHDLIRLQQDGVHSFVLHCSNSAVTDHLRTINAVGKAHGMLHQNSKITSLEILDASHNYGDMLGHFAVTAAANLIIE